MRWGMAIALLALAGCIPRSHQAEPPRQPARQAEGDPATLQCHIDLARENIGFRVLPDRDYGGGCRAVGAVQLTATGIPTTNLGAMTCPLARQFARWSREVVQGAATDLLGSQVARIETFGTYACRPVNGQVGGRLSEHALANAVDVSAFVLADGRRVTVLDGWSGGDERVRRFLRGVHRGGCQRFSVGLGPNSDRQHQNHLHFDMGPRGTCR